MRELRLLRQIAESYRALRLKNSRAFWALALMLVTAILEMSGLSLLYPVVLAMGNNDVYLTKLFAWLPFKSPALQDPIVQILVVFAGVAVLYVAKNIALYFTFRYNISFAMYYYRNLIRGLYSAYLRKTPLQFREESSGSLANIICVQSGRLVDGVIRPLLVVIVEAMLLLSIAAVVCYVNPLLIGVIIVFCGGAAAIYYAAFRSSALKWGRIRMDSGAVLQELVSNTSVGISEIKIFHREDFMIEKVVGAATTETDMFQKLEMYQQGPRFLIESVFVLSFVSTFAVLLILGTDKSTLLAGFSVVAAASFRILPSMNRLVASYSSCSFNLGPALGLMETITSSHLLHHSESPGHEKNAERGLRPTTVELRGISFRYPGSPAPILRDVHLTIRRGQRIGIAGRSGSGKSTLIDILAGLYSPTGGEILIDGRPLSADPRGWQAGIGYVPQIPFIMPGSIRENVVFSSNSVSDDRIWAILQMVGLAGFVRGLKNGLDAPLGERGTGLSGGQKQLVCLARALFRNPHILLLDEPTASLDQNSEEMVLEAVRSLPSEATIVMVSHKHGNFAGFDVTYACEDGGLKQRKYAAAYRVAGSLIQ
jgi:ATP-binding cassette, subfamily B, bacterial PglK